MSREVPICIYESLGGEIPTGDLSFVTYTQEEGQFCTPFNGIRLPLEISCFGYLIMTYHRLRPFLKMRRLLLYLLAL